MSYISYHCVWSVMVLWVVSVMVPSRFLLPAVIIVLGTFNGVVFIGPLSSAGISSVAPQSIGIVISLLFD